MKKMVKICVVLLAILLSLSGKAAEAAPSTTLVRWGNFYGRGDYYPYSINCAPGSVAIGLFGLSGAGIDRIGLICAPVQSNGTLGSSYEAGFVGGYGGGGFSLVCANGYALESIYGRTGGGALDRIGIRCRTLSLSNYYIGGSTGGWGGWEFWDAAYPGQWVTRITGSNDLYVRGIQVGYSVINW